MPVERRRTPLSVERFLEIQGKIVNRIEGEGRKYLQEHYVVKDGQFITKDDYDKRIEAGKAPLGIVAKDPSDQQEEYKNYLATYLGFIQENTKCSNEHGVVDKTIFNDIQGFLMTSNYPFLWINKTRQFGYSFLLAARALAKSFLKPRHTNIFVSYNEEESKEKIVYARELYESMPMKWKLARKLKYDNKNSLVFEKMGPSSSETRILSYPQRIVRGKGGELDIDLDEAAHCIHIRKIYVSALPALSRNSTSCLWIGSSPSGKSGLFYEIGINQDNEYAPFVRMTVPWWAIDIFCTNVAKAREVAWDMHTDERIALFASERIKLIRRSMPLDDFRQEYECEYLDEAYSYFPWDLINSCVQIFNVDAVDMPDYDSPGNDLSEGDRSKSGVGIDHYRDFEEFLLAIRKEEITGNILGGFDVGRTTDASEIYYIEEDPDTKQQIARCNITLKNVPLPRQREIVLNQFSLLGDKLTKFGVDYNGIGRNIAEDLEELSYEKVVKLNFNSNAWKEEACRRFKFRMEKRAITFATDRRVLSQIHSIKRLLLPGGLWRFDTEENAKHHGDKFWALLAASEVGYSIDASDGGYTSFDERVLKQDTDRAKAINSYGMPIIADHMNSSLIKYNPWASIYPFNSIVNNISLPRINSMEGLMRMPDTITFNR